MVDLATTEVDGRRVVVSAADATLRTWDPAAGEPVGEPIDGQGSGEPLRSQGSGLALGSMAVTVLDTRPCVVAGGGVAPGRGGLLAWDLNIREQLGETQFFPKGVRVVTPYPDGPEGSLVIGFGTEVALLTPR